MTIGKFVGAAAAVALVALVNAAPDAQAATLDFTMTVDNSYDVYLSTNDALLGAVHIGAGPPASGTGDWRTPTTFSTVLSGSGPLFIHIVAVNDNSTAPHDPVANPDAVLGSFAINGGGYHFSNGLTTLDTDTTHWKAIDVTSTTPWVTPTNTPQAFAFNGGGPWSGAGVLPGISTNAQWIWSYPDNLDFALLSTEITATTPLPAALPLFAGGLGVLGLVARRRKKKAEAAAV